jgi:hypothetical protein
VKSRKPDFCVGHVICSYVRINKVHDFIFVSILNINHYFSVDSGKAF